MTTCENCKHLNYTYSGGDIITCRRYPPKSASGRVEDLRAGNVFPLTRLDFSCGEWKADE